MSSSIVWSDILKCLKITKTRISKIKRLQLILIDGKIKFFILAKKCPVLSVLSVLSARPPSHRPEFQIETIPRTKSISYPFLNVGKREIGFPKSLF